MIVIIHNRKGGVGKTTTAINVAMNLADAGEHVLLIDGDHQHNASRGLGCDPRPGVFEWIVHQQFMPQTVRPLLDLLPSASQPGSLDRQWLQEARLDTVANRFRSLPHYDWVIVDTAPSESPWVDALLRLGEFILIPVDFSIYSIEGVADLLGVLDRRRIIGLVPVRYDLRNNRSIELLDFLKHAGADLVAPPIRVGVDVDRAAQKGLSMAEFNPRSTVAEDYRILTDWMVTRLAEKI
jgi:chromosome partitioning protein